MSEKPDPISIAATLGLRRVRDASIVPGGSDTEIWRVSSGGGSYAIRLFRPDRAKVRDKEVLVMRAAAAAGVPVPRVHASGTWRDRPVLLLSWCAGRPLWDEVRDRPEAVWEIGEAFGTAQAKIHAIEVSTEMAGALPLWMDWTGDGEEALLEGLRDAGPRRGSLLHLDGIKSWTAAWKRRTGLG